MQELVAAEDGQRQQAREEFGEVLEGSADERRRRGLLHCGEQQRSRASSSLLDKLNVLTAAQLLRLYMTLTMRANFSWFVGHWSGMDGAPPLQLKGARIWGVATQTQPHSNYAAAICR